MSIPICEVIQASQVNANHTVTILNPAGITTVTPTGSRPAIKGDVYSIQPDGTIQGRPAGANGPFEVGAVDGTMMIFRPSAATGPAFEMPYTEIK